MKLMKNLLIGLFLVGALAACGDKDEKPPVVVTPPAAVNITAATDFFVGAPVQLTAKDVGGVDITVIWSIVEGDTDVAGVVLDTKTGIVTATKQGAISTVKATLGTDTATISVKASNTAPETVTVAAITVIAPKGYSNTAQLKAIAKYTDEVMNIDVTVAATWDIAPLVKGITVATATGIVTAEKDTNGTAKVIGTVMGIPSDPATITAESKGISHLYIVVADSNTAAVTTASVVEGGTTQLLAYAVFDNETVPHAIAGKALLWTTSASEKVAVDATTGIISGEGTFLAADTAEITLKTATGTNPEVEAVTKITASVTEKIEAPVLPATATVSQLPTYAATGNRLILNTDQTFTVTAVSADGTTSVEVPAKKITWEVTDAGGTGAEVSTDGVFTADTAANAMVSIKATVATGVVGNTATIDAYTSLYVVTDNIVESISTTDITLNNKVTVGVDYPVSTTVTYTSEGDAKVINPTGMGWEIIDATADASDWSIKDNVVTVGAEIGSKAKIEAGFAMKKGPSAEITAVAVVAPTLESVSVVRPAVATYPDAPAPLVIIGDETMTLTASGVMTDKTIATLATTTWVSGSDTIAKVTDDGVVTGVANFSGPATMTPTSKITGGDDVPSTTPATVYVIFPPAP